MDFVQRASGITPHVNNTHSRFPGKLQVPNSRTNYNNQYLQYNLIILLNKFDKHGVDISVLTRKSLRVILNKMCFFPLMLACLLRNLVCM